MNLIGFGLHRRLHTAPKEWSQATLVAGWYNVDPSYRTVRVPRRRPKKLAPARRSRR